MLAATAVTLSVFACGAAAQHAASTPPMGWNPWNAFRTEVSEG